MEVRILGTLQVGHEGGLVEFARPQQLALVAALAVRANQVVPAERLIENLWDARPPEHPDASLRAHVSHVRRALARAGCGAPLVSRRPGYVLELGPDELDAWRFERLVGAGRDQLTGGAVGDAIASLRAALALWRGPALADFVYASFASAEARRLDEARLVAIEDLFEARLANGDHHALVGELRRLVDEHPLRERLWGQLMVALYRAGRQAEALRAYAGLRQTLAEELGIDPSPALQRLEADVLRQDPRIEGNAPSSVVGGPAAPPLPALPRRSVPTAISSFVGREREKTVVRSLLVQNRLVTLTGPGGCGKTRLALEVADAQDAPVALVELAPVTDATLVEDAVAGALGVPEDPSRPVADSLRAAIAAAPILIVLDNCEHVLDASARLAETLLGACPGLRVLATSRRRLGITGENVWPVPALQLPDIELTPTGTRWWESEAVRLFAERAAAVHPDFAVDDDNAEAVVELCRKLDGLPLALELAAARMAVLSAEEIVDRLSDPLRLLSVGSPVAPPRQQTLRAAVDWSYRSLLPAEQRLFARLSVFRGGFTLEAAEAVAALSPPEAASVLDGLTALAGSSLVTRVPNPAGRARLRMLETLRAYAEERLGEQAELEVTAQRHAEWCRNVAMVAAPQLRGPQQGQALAVLDIEEDNLRAGLDSALAAGHADAAFDLTSALWWYWFRRGRIREGRDRLRRLLSLGALAGEQRCATLAVAAYLSWIASDEVQAAALSGQALLAAQQGHVPPPALALDVAGLVAHSAGDVEGAEVLYERARAAFRVGADAWGEAWVLRHLSGTRHRRSLLHEAAALAEESLARFLELGDDWGVAGSIDALASIARRRGELSRARLLGEESIERHRAMGEHVGLAIALHHQAELLLDLGELPGAAELARESIALDRRHGAEEDLAVTSALLAEIDRRRARSPA